MSIQNHQLSLNNFSFKTRNNNPTQPVVTSPVQNPTQTAKANRVYTISFTGKDKNPNQVLMISAERNPHAKKGGMGDVIAELPEEMNGKEIRTATILYNPQAGVEKGKLAYVTNKGKEFAVEDTGIKTEFTYGVRKSTAHLYKSKEPVTKKPQYFIYCPDIKDEQPYSAPYSSMCKSHIAFSVASLKLLKEWAKNDKEDFNPKFLNTTDWHTAFAIGKLKELSEKDDFYKDIDSVHTIHNIGYIYQGKMDPVLAAVLTFNKDELKELTQDIAVDNELVKIMLGEKAESGSLREALRNGIQDSELDNSKLLLEMSNKYEAYQTKYPGQMNKLNDLIRNKFPNKPWDIGNHYNLHKLAVKEADTLHTVSDTFAEEIKTYDALAPNGLAKDIADRQANGKRPIFGVVNGLIPEIFDPSKTVSPVDPDKEEIVATYTVDTVKEGKAANKKHLQHILRDLSKEMTPDQKDARIKELKAKEKLDQKEKAELGDLVNRFGYLEEKSDAPLFVHVARYDKEQKGANILIGAAEEFLVKNPKAQLAIAGGGYAKDGKPDDGSVDWLVQLTEKYPGRVVLDANFANMHQYLASADFYVAPSNFEPCGLIQLQAMRMGAVPIVTNTGGLKDTVNDPEMDQTKKPTGFKTAKKPVECADNREKELQLIDVLDRACAVYEKDKTTWNNMVKNAMLEDTSWQKSAVERYNKEVFVPKSAYITSEIQSKEPESMDFTF